MPTQSRDFENHDSPAESLVFPNDSSVFGGGRDAPGHDLTALPASAGQVYDAIEHMSRRIDHLARELGCLGYFDDDDDDSPRAA